MNAKTIIPITEARAKIFEIANAVQSPGIHYTLTEKGRPKAVLVSATEFESWQETLEVMQDFPDLKKDIEEAERDYKSGAYKTYITLDELLLKYGYETLRDKGTKEYDVHGPAQAKRGKRTAKNS